MEDPPIQPPPIVPPDDGSNPFAPTQSYQLPPGRGSVHLPPAYWIMALVAMVVFIVVSFLFSGVGVPPIIALVLALIRVPLVQKRLSRIAPEKSQVAPIWMLLVSWCFMLLCLFGALLAFVVVCLPTSIFAFATGPGSGDETFILVIGLSSFVALAAYGFLFYLSLKLPI